MEQLQNQPKDIYDYITQKETAFANPINILGWEWSMAEHIKKSFYYKHGRLLNGNDDDTPVKNITKPILNMQYWTEDIDVKDVTLYIENPDKNHLSFLVKKYHDDVFVKENNLDTFFDELNQNRIDYGGGISMDIGKPKPEVMPLESIAFCNQSNLISSPIGFKYYYSPQDLQEMEDRGWGLEENGATVSIEEAITLALNQGSDKDTPSKTSGEYIAIYLVLGSLPQKYLDDGDSNRYVYQMHVVGFYRKQDGEKAGITLFRKKIKNPLKLIKRDPVFGRTLGYGGAEELFEAAVWTNYDIQRHKEMLDAASKIVHLSDDEGFYSRNRSLKNVQNNQVLLVEQGRTVKQMDTYPRNAALFEKSINDWQAYAQQMGGAPNPLMGQEPNSGTPFKLQEMVVQTGKSPHDWRRGQYAKHVEEIYRDWIIPYIENEITKDQEFLSTLSLEEMQKVSNKVVNNAANKYIKDKILNGEMVLENEVEVYKQKIKEDFMKDNTKFLKILKGELKGVALNISINVAAKQKNLSAMTDKLVNIFRQVMSSVNPQTGQSVLDDPKMSKIFDQILEYSGLSPIDFYTGENKNLSFNRPTQQMQPVGQQINQDINKF